MRVRHFNIVYPREAFPADAPKRVRGDTHRDVRQQWEDLPPDALERREQCAHSEHWR